MPRSVRFLLARGLTTDAVTSASLCRLLEMRREALSLLVTEMPFDLHRMPKRCWVLPWYRSLSISAVRFQDYRGKVGNQFQWLHPCSWFQTNRTSAPHLTAQVQSQLIEIEMLLHFGTTNAPDFCRVSLVNFVLFHRLNLCELQNYNMEELKILNASLFMIILFSSITFVLRSRYNSSCHASADSHSKISFCSASAVVHGHG